MSNHGYLALKSWNERRIFSVKWNDENTLKDVVKEMNLYMEQYRIYFYREEDTDMIELHIDDCYVYDISDTSNICI